MEPPTTTPAAPSSKPPAIALELRSLTAAADLLDALRGIPPATEADARRRARLADQLGPALCWRLQRQD
ncbi:hypothetical protein [Streptomyces ipomoeae]|uniref:hypothetical protein n=1 Tax=Streptomyces ipomoeae TaxID=103232 RepID=UPI00114797D5|nr:hypothetical protein [Streptomyces ipomoeae]TQE33173.1 hypothetical protein Sipo7851_22030 [Streptomyces ipomoeae]